MRRLAWFIALAGMSPTGIGNTRNLLCLSWEWQLGMCWSVMRLVDVDTNVRTACQVGMSDFKVHDHGVNSSIPEGTSRRLASGSGCRSQ